MPLDIRQRPAARRDLLEIWLYIADENERAADGVLDRISDALSMLASHPFSGRNRPELNDALRSFPVETYVIFYIPKDEYIDVVRILSGYRDVSDAQFANLDH